MNRSRPILVVFVGASLATISSAAEVHRTTYRGWPALELGNGLVSVSVVPDIGGRVIQYKLGEREFLWVNPDLAGKAPPPGGLGPDGQWLNYGGDKLWPAPQGWENDEQWPGPPDAVLDGSPHAAEILPVRAGEAAIRLTSGEDRRSGIQFLRTVRLVAGTTRVAFDVTMKNVDTKPRRWGIWTNTQVNGARPDGQGFNPELVAYCPLNPRSRLPGGYRVLFGAADNPTFQPLSEPRLMRVPYQYKVGKIGLDSAAGWVATVDTGTGDVFVQRFEFEPGREYPDGSSVEFWSSGLGSIRAWGRDVAMKDDPRETPYLLECELLSPFARLPPGASYSWRYEWCATNIGRRQSVIDGSPLAVISEPLTARRPAGAEQLELSGRFGVFQPGTLELELLDAAGQTILRRELQAVTPLKPAIVQWEDKVPAITAAASLRLIGEDGRLAGEIAKAAVAGGALAWVEAEAYVAQSGSRAAKYDMPTASGGACVDNDWGGQEGHFLRYRFETPTDWAALHVSLRYARETAGDAKVRLTLDGDAAKSVTVSLPSTGNWGFTVEGWRYAAAALPAIGRGLHELEIRSLADRNNVNFDGFYLSDRPLPTAPVRTEPPRGASVVRALDKRLAALPCKTPLAAPYSLRKAFVAGDGTVQTLLSSPQPAGIGHNLLGPSVQVLLDGHGPWQQVEQSLVCEPVPTVRTVFMWPELTVTQEALAAVPEDQGFRLRVTVQNRQPQPRDVELVALVENAAGVMSNMPSLLRPLPTNGVSETLEAGSLPGPLGGPPRWRYRLRLDGMASKQLELQLLGDGGSYQEAVRTATDAWGKWLAPASRVQLPDPTLQYAFDASLRQMLMLLERRGDDVRVLKGLQHYYGANPYDTFQVSRALDAVGLRGPAEEILRHQMRHLKKDGLFEMWETGNLDRTGADQWIVQGLAAVALGNHFDGRPLTSDTGAVVPASETTTAWLREITPTLIQAAHATTKLRREHAGKRQQGNVEVDGWLPPIGGDGGLGVGYHWSQNTGPAAGVRLAAEAARRLGRPEADELRAAAADYQAAIDAVRQRSVAATAAGVIPAFPGATGDAVTHPLWGVVMSVTAFDGIPADDPAAVHTLRFLQEHLRGGLHLNLGYSRGVWPYLSAEVAQWHLRLGEYVEAWRILQAMVGRASSTVCWYEEIDDAPPRGHGDPADVWAAAECVYLTRRLLASERGEELLLVPGLPAEWMKPGAVVGAERLPTPWGECSFSLRFVNGGVRAEVTLPEKHRPRKLRLCVAATDDEVWRQVEVTGATAHSRAGRDLMVEQPDRTLRITVSR